MNRTIHKFYIPEGTWYDITTGKKFPGGKSYVSFFREQDYPVFARGGAIIRMSNDEKLNDTFSDERIISTPNSKISSPSSDKRLFCLHQDRMNLK